MTTGPTTPFTFTVRLQTRALECNDFFWGKYSEIERNIGIPLNVNIPSKPNSSERKKNDAKQIILSEPRGSTGV